MGIGKGRRLEVTLPRSNPRNSPRWASSELIGKVYRGAGVWSLSFDSRISAHSRERSHYRMFGWNHLFLPAPAPLPPSHLPAPPLIPGPFSVLGDREPHPHLEDFLRWSPLPASFRKIKKKWTRPRKAGGLGGKYLPLPCRNLEEKLSMKSTRARLNSPDTVQLPTQKKCRWPLPTPLTPLPSSQVVLPFSRIERFAVNFAKPGQSNLILERLLYLWYRIRRTVWGALDPFNQRPMLRFEVVWREGDTQTEKERERNTDMKQQLTNPPA